MKARRTESGAPPTEQARPTHLAIRDWADHQHYRDRRPPWIKLHRSILTNATFLALPEAAQAQLIKLWVLASQMGHPLPYNAKLLQGQIGTTGRFYLETIIASGLMVPCYQDASNALADSKQNARALRTEREEEKTTTPRRAKRERPPSENWVAELAKDFQDAGGVVREGHLGAALKGAKERFGAPVLRTAIGLWLSERKANGWSCAFPKFAADHVRWCEEAVKLRDAANSGVDYWDNEALQRVTRPSLVA